MKRNDIKDDVKPMSLLSLILSFMALFVISALLFFPLKESTRQVLIGLDFIICSVFLLQLTIDLIRSANRLQYLKRHWVDFLASIPMVEPLRFARLFHILRVILVIRSSHSLIKQLMTNRRETTLASILLLMVILLTIGSSMMLFVESKAPNANIQTGGDAMWWALVTISTVGYGDHYPVTNAGKVLASGLIICGVGIFGMISGLITSLLASPTEVQAKRSENKERLLLEVLEKQQEILMRLECIEKQQNKNKES
ncbi:capsular polysaccharide biosynthesis protein [Vibrio zhanjiangensis]|uniref:Capsular polysaccharide biosynthesis protein n=1 Tax=Vibrio zhanjiangensis TaxID=1046128 RepID=A0ABQ6EYC0_9VIBR|nr:ion transporter [Vibrio zhanjiangensis]GLT18163.1 capsular polysaccharide biosynthesis protein [Vibrio zhanjiangensis]